jgi:hypothetical protein
MHGRERIMNEIIVEAWQRSSVFLKGSNSRHDFSDFLHWTLTPRIPRDYVTGQ